MDKFIISIILPIFGILIVFFCILSFVFPYGEKFKGKTQKIKAFGVDLEVSVLSLFIIIGLILSLIGLFLQVKDYENQLDFKDEEINDVKNNADAAKLALEQAQKRQIVLLVTLEDISENNMPKFEDIYCSYQLYGEVERVRVDVNPGYESHQLRITLKGLESDALIASLELTDKEKNRKWVKKTFMPFEPEVQLKKE